MVTDRKSLSLITLKRGAGRDVCTLAHSLKPCNSKLVLKSIIVLNLQVDVQDATLAPTSFPFLNLEGQRLTIRDHPDVVG